LFRIAAVGDDRFSVMGSIRHAATSSVLDRVLRQSRPLDLATVAGMTGDELVSQLEVWHRLRAVADGSIVQLLGEVMRREEFRSDGAAKPEDWQVERFGLSVASARNNCRVAERAMDLPHLTRALSSGDISLDKLRAVVGVATPETDRELAECAGERTVAELGEMAESLRRRRRDSVGKKARTQGSTCFNETCHTMSVQLPAEEFAEVRAAVETHAKALPSDGETRWDHRQYDALLGLIRAGASGRSGPGGGRSPYFAVLHAPLAALLDESGDPSELVGDLERGGLLSLETVRRLLCDCTFVVAIEDDDGHTMYEGRQRRLATGAQRREIWHRDRCCRFPGCRNAIFTEPHHLDWWIRGGKTDLPNLALLCKFHHGLMHSKGWTVSGDANGEIVFVGPSGRALTSRPSPRWTAISRVGADSTDRARTSPPRGSPGSPDTS
jgi:hypothetical protein